MSSRALKRLFVVAALLVVGLIAVFSLNKADDGPLLTATVQEASYISPGTKVVIGGSQVGKVKRAEVAEDGRARLEMTIDDDDAWPLPKTTKMRLRWLGTIAYAGRYVELTIPKDQGPYLADGGTIAVDEDDEQVEFDKVFGTFDDRTRRGLRSTLRTAGESLELAGTPLRKALDVAPPAVREARAVTADIGYRPQTLTALIRSTDNVLASVERSDPALGDLLTGAAGTFRATAIRERELGEAIRQTPPTLTAARHTLARVDGTLERADVLTRRIAGGSRELRRLAPALTRILDTVVEVGPDATKTLAVLRSGAPAINRLLTRARTLTPDLVSTTRQAAEQLKCVRPYAPEVAGLASTWASFTAAGDRTDKFARLYTPSLPWDTTPLNPGEAKKLFPALRYAFPRPPGEVVGQPWFIPECGVGPETVDPAQDPEAP